VECRVGSDAFRPEMYKPLPLDTAYFDSEFKWRVLAEISKSVGLDDALDGLLVKSENFQALNTLLVSTKPKSRPFTLIRHSTRSRMLTFSTM